MVAVAAPLPAAVAAGDPLRGDQWALDRIGARAGWSAGGGRRVVIAVVDTGVDLSHEDLASKIVAGRDFVEGDGRPQDEHGHGTHVAGIAAAAAGNGLGVGGVAPRARIMPVRVLDEDGRGSTSSVAAGIRWATDNGAQVINLSLGDLGQPLFGPAFSDALDYAWANGAIPVVAAGNDYLLSSGYAAQPAIVVSATNRSDGKPGYSSGVGSARWGMAAPGGAGGALGRAEDDILSTERGSRYGYRAGTSMAAPHLAGAAAILRARGLGPNDTVQRLLRTAKDIGSQGRDPTFGHGRLDVAAAVRGLPGAGGAGGDGGGGGQAPRPSETSEGGGGAEGAGSGGGRGGGGSGGSDAGITPVPSGAGPHQEAEAAGEEPAGATNPLVPIGLTIGSVIMAVLLGWMLFRPGPGD